VVSLHVGFPNCWDGVLTHANDTAHLRHPVGDRCPAGFSHALPRLILRTEYPVGSGGRITLSSGPAFTAHGDFWNTWDQAKLASLVDRCLNAGRDCGVFRGSGSGAGGVPISKPPPSKPSAPAPARPAASTTHAKAPVTSSAVDTTAGHQHHPGVVAARAAATTGPQDTADRVGGSALPFTGEPTGALVVLGIGLLGTGGAFLARGWRLRRAPRH
jgi:Domain of unknown function (DUF1996)